MLQLNHWFISVDQVLTPRSFPEFCHTSVILLHRAQRLHLLPFLQPPLLLALNVRLLVRAPQF